MPVTHEPWLVALSLVVAIQGAFVGLSLAVQVGSASGARRRWLLAAAALSLAVAIWAMHFVAMLAARLPFPVDYLAFPTLLSFLVCVLVVGIAVVAVSFEPLTLNRLVASAVFMGLGIASMHYIGMTALHASAHMTHSPGLVIASIAIAIAASGLALRLATGAIGRPPLLLSAVALGIAIAGMHYTAMGAVSIFPHTDSPSSAPALSADLLAIIVAVVAFVVSGLFLLILVPDRDSGAASADTSAVPNVGGQAMATTVRLLPAAPHVGVAPGNHDPIEIDAEIQNRLPADDATRHIPVEHDGLTRLLPVDAIVAVHANAHYTYVFDGTTKYFCTLAIGDIESRLDPMHFARVHRSHIINLDRVVRLKRKGDNGLLELDGHDAYTVPVSRSRLAWVKSHLVDAKPRAAAS